MNGKPAKKVAISLDGRSFLTTLSLAEAHPKTMHYHSRDLTILHEGGQSWKVDWWRYQNDAATAAGDGTILSPMPGRIIAVEVAAGDTVTKGQKLLTLEAMKMEHSLTAPFDGMVAELNAEVGAQVQVEALLVRIEAVDKE